MGKDSPALARALNKALKGLNPGTHIYLAYSGGLDSQTLLHVAAKWAQEKDCKLVALHLNHGLSSYAQDWQGFCERQCEVNGISLRCETVSLKQSTKGNLEQLAREARYDWFESLLGENDVLLTAHHREDQAETVLLRLLRASGVRGLAAIPASRILGRGRLVRPFLEVSKAKLRAYAEYHELSWIEDESNYSTEFDRNYIRHNVMPALLQRWPHASRQISRVAQNCRDDQSLLDELATMDIKAIQDRGRAAWLDVMPPLDLAGLSVLSIPRQRNILQYMLRSRLIYPVPAEQMSEWLRQVSDASIGTQSQLKLEGVSLVLHDGKLHFIRSFDRELSSTSIQWNTSEPLEISDQDYRIKLVQRSPAPSTEVKALIFEPGETVCVHWRRGGERVQLQSEKFSRSLKKLFQEKRVAPWLRRAMPLISVDGYIVWSAALGDFSPRLVDSDGQYYSFDLLK